MAIDQPGFEFKSDPRPALRKAALPVMVDQQGGLFVEARSERPVVRFGKACRPDFLARPPRPLPSLPAKLGEAGPVDQSPPVRLQAAVAKASGSSAIIASAPASSLRRSAPVSGRKRSA